MAERWWSSWVPAVVPYAILLRLLIDGRMCGEEFESVFLPLYKQDSTDWPADIFDILESLFSDVDDFTPDGKLRAEVNGIDERELRKRGALVFERLSTVAG